MKVYDFQMPGAPIKQPLTLASDAELVELAEYCAGQCVCEDPDCDVKRFAAQVSIIQHARARGLPTCR